MPHSSQVIHIVCICLRFDWRFLVVEVVYTKKCLSHAFCATQVASVPMREVWPFLCSEAKSKGVETGVVDECVVHPTSMYEIAVCVPSDLQFRKKKLLFFFFFFHL